MSHGSDLTGCQKVRTVARVHTEILEAIPMAPAAGAGVVRDVAAELATRPAVVVKMADALERGLTATRRVWDKDAKTWIEEPDTRSQLQAVFGIFSHFAGDPQKRIVHEHVQTAGLDPLTTLRESPALLEAAERLVQKAAWRTSGHQEHKRPEKAAAAVLEVD